MASTTQAKYDAAVTKYGKSFVDNAMKDRGITIESSTTQQAETGTVKPSTTSDSPTIKIEPVDKEFLPHVAKASGEYTPEEIAQNRAADIRDAENAAKAKARRLKREYEAAVKKAGGSINALKLAEKKYGVNSKEYRLIKSKVDKYEKPTSTVREFTPKVSTATPDPKVTESKGLTESQYNQLVGKYGDAEGVKAAADAKYGKNSIKSKAVADLINRYNKTTDVKKVRENISVITDATIKDSSDDFKGVLPEETESVVFAKNWQERIPVAEKYGIKNYTGTAEQNILLRKKLKEVKTETDFERSQREAGITPEKQAEFDRQQAEGDKVSGDVEKLGSKEDPTPKEIKDSQKTIDQLKELRLSGKRDVDLLKQIEDKYGKDSVEYLKLKNFIDRNPRKDGTEGIDESILEQSKKELSETQIKSLEDIRDDNISITAENFLKGAGVIAENNENLQEFYKTMAEELKTFIVDAEAKKREAMERTKTTELNRVVGLIRATLARRGVRIGNIAPEQLIAMSGEIGGKALENINNAISTMENEILALTEQKTREINELKEKGLINQSEADLSIEQMRQLKEKMISDIKSNYISNAFKIAQAQIADTDKTKAEVMNTISTFVSGLGISGKAQGIMENYIDASNSIEALRNMISDLNNPDSQLYKAVGNVEKANQLAAEFANKLALMKAAPAASVSSAASDTKISSTNLLKLNQIADNLNVPALKDVRTIAEYNNLLSSLGETGVKIQNDLVGIQ